MDRRLFLATALGVGTLAAGRPASAFQVADCDTTVVPPGCRALNEHAALLAKINAVLAGQGLDEQQRKAVMARLSCPTCGLPLVVAGGAF